MILGRNLPTNPLVICRLLGWEVRQESQNLMVTEPFHFTEEETEAKRRAYLA